jgi:hypothetical protein
MNQRKLRTVAVTLFATLAMVITCLLNATPATALGKVKCGDTGPVTVANVDPIMDHNGTGSMHEHQVFGNTSWVAKGDSANYTDLINGSTDCRLPADTAGYWTPTLRYISGPKKGQLIATQQFTAYYRDYTNNGKFGPGQAFPADTRLVSEPGHGYWDCGDKSGTSPTAFVPSCVGQSGKPGHTLTAHIELPSCWDGVLPNHKSTDVGDTSDNAHYAYPVRKVCPAGFPNKMVGLRETLQFTYVGDGTDVALASDAMMGTSDGRSLHADFWNGWQQDKFVAFAKQCVQGIGYTTKACMP